MKIGYKRLLTSSSILSAPGFISIIISLLSIPVHLNFAGPESYGNYIIFHFILLFSINFNLGIGKSSAISINNFPKNKKEIGYKAIQYTTNVALIILSIFLLLNILKKISFYNYNDFYEFTSFLIIGSIITIYYITFEGILQGNRKFTSISIFNLFFFSLSFSVPSILLIFFKSLSLYNLIFISIIIKFFSILIMFLIIKKNRLSIKAESKILKINLKKNSKWITLNGVLVQFYDLFDKYLIKFFLGPIALASYSVPQQLTGKLSIMSKSFSAFLLPDLSKKKINNLSFNFSLKIFLKIIPLFIFSLIPFYPFILELWLGGSYNETIHHLTKIFSLSVIFSCASHILTTKFEASKTLSRNLKFEFFLMPFFLIGLFYLTSGNYSLINLSILILIKELILFFLRLNFLKSEIKEINSYYLYSIYFILMLFLSFYNQNFFYLSIMLLFFNYFRK